MHDSNSFSSHQREKRMRLPIRIQYIKREHVLNQVLKDGCCRRYMIWLEKKKNKNTQKFKNYSVMDVEMNSPVLWEGPSNSLGVVEGFVSSGVVSCSPSPIAVSVSVSIHRALVREENTDCKCIFSTIFFYLWCSPSPKSYFDFDSDSVGLLWLSGKKVRLLHLIW